MVLDAAEVVRGWFLVVFWVVSWLCVGGCVGVWVWVCVGGCVGVGVCGGGGVVVVVVVVGGGGGGGGLTVGPFGALTAAFANALV